MEKDTEEFTTTADGVWHLDVDTFIPKPEGYLTIKRVEYPIFGFLDIAIEDSLKVARVGDDIEAAKSYDERMERSIEQIMLLNAPGTPRLTRENFKGVRPRQIITLTVLAMSIAKVPLKADRTESAEPAGSPSPSPESAASTAGDRGRSSD